MIHYANHVRPNADSIKVGGHQASCASSVGILTAYYFGAAEPDDLIAIKPHAAPVYHAIQYLLGGLREEKMRELRAFGGLQSYPCRLKDPDTFHFSTGSVGFGAVMPHFMSLARHYVTDHFGYEKRPRFLSLMGDAELDEGNVWEALSEDSLQKLGRVIWMVDLNRQSLDRVVPTGRAQKVKSSLSSFGFHVIEVKYGSRLEAAFAKPGGAKLRARIDEMPNSEYQALLRMRATGQIVELLCRRPGGQDAELAQLLAGEADLPGLVSDLGGHDLKKLLAAFAEANTVTDRPVAIVAYTVKGWGLPLAGDPTNHARLLTDEQMEELRVGMGLEAGAEFVGFAAGTAEALACEAARRSVGLERDLTRKTVAAGVPESLERAYTGEVATQQAFGNVMSELARMPEARRRLVTASPDVAVSTGLGGWLQKVGVYSPEDEIDYFGEQAVPVALKWKQGKEGQHVELGISENNLFLMLGALGVTSDLLGEPLAPVGTLYDTFISRGLDALHYAVYNGGKFIVVGTPSGISLGPEGGLHQSLMPPSFGIESPMITYYEPCFAKEMEWILLEGIRRILEDSKAESVYLRLSTVAQRQELFPAGRAGLRADVLRGGYRLVDYSGRAEYAPGVNVVNLFTCGAMVPQAVAASEELAAEELFVNVIAVTSPDLLHRGWVQARRARMNGRAAGHHLETLVPERERGCPQVTVMDGHPHALSFLGSVFGAKTVPLGVDQYGQSGARLELYEHYEISVAAMVKAAIEAIG
ncbi:MAG: pyruvate dehydrogenase [Acidobacteria bacterium]|nr:pyruvate dehydrogenase [Acidobacteriota bacterium]